MSYNRKLTLSLAIVLTLFGASALAQQGWSQAQVIKQRGNPANVNAVFYDGDDLWVVGAEGLITRSYDDGRTFQETDLGVNEGLNDVFVLKNNVWIVGDASAILISTDGGLSFVKRLYSPYRAGSGQQGQGGLDLYSVQFVDKEKGYIVGDEGLILASTDGGYSWREQRSGTDEQLFHLSFRGKRGWAVGTSGIILHTRDGGRNWYPQQSGTTDDLNRVYFVDDRTGLITGDNGALLLSQNGGSTWERVQLRVKEPLFGMSFIDKKTGWVVGYGGRIIRTYDGGRNWVEQESNTAGDLFSVSFHKNRGYAIGRDGLVMRYYERR
ncbi:MAG: YCF48-related protein [Blastocatellia bacterium]|nr:YCF48-related protein [Blastocatellia bacterium]